MKSIIIILLLTSFTGVSLAKTAPDFPITETSTFQHLSALKGQVVYLDFWASWCKPCRRSFPWMNQIQQKYADSGFKVITINLDKDDNLISEFLNKYPANFTIVKDPQGIIAKKYEIEGMPSSYLIDKNGEIKFTHIGFFEKKKAQYQEEIESLLHH